MSDTQDSAAEQTPVTTIEDVVQWVKLLAVMIGGVVVGTVASFVVMLLYSAGERDRICGSVRGGNEALTLALGDAFDLPPDHPEVVAFRDAWASAMEDCG